jgi:hypothetical protein
MAEITSESVAFIPESVADLLRNQQSNMSSGFTGTSEPISFAFIGRTLFVFTPPSIAVFFVAQDAGSRLPDFRVLRVSVVR